MHIKQNIKYDLVDNKNKKTIEFVFKHPSYNSFNLSNDIAILILSYPVQYSKYIKPACLPEKSLNYPKDGSDCYGIGWV